MSQTWFAAHASSRLFSGRVDQTRESGGNRAYPPSERKTPTLGRNFFNIRFINPDIWILLGMLIVTMLEMRELFIHHEEIYKF